MKLQFVTSRSRAADIKEFVFKPEDNFTWQAGQYMHYVLPHDDVDDRGSERWFTNSAAPSEGEIRITTRIAAENGSSFKRALQALKPGDVVEADGPEGDFVITDPSRNYIFVAGGIGITPLRSILTEAAAQNQQLNVQLLYHNRSDDIPFKNELDTLQAKNPNLSIEYIVLPNSLTSGMVFQKVQTTDNPLVYISGPEPMVKSFEAELKQSGLREESIKIDDFPGYESV